MKSSCVVHIAAGACSLLAVLLYTNTLRAELVFDDLAAISTNKDLRPTSPWSSILYHDFWGDDILHSKSHKSFRPITTATFKLNYHLHGDEPKHYHSVNVFLNAVVSYLFVLLAHRVLKMEISLAALSGVLYTVHPLHTEAVAGVVGRAELLSTIFFMLTMFTYRQAAEGKQRKAGWTWLAVSMFLSTCAMFSKEQGVTVVAVCLSYEAFVVLKMNCFEVLRVLHAAVFKPQRLSLRHACFMGRCAVMILYLVAVVLLRLALMGSSPHFSKSDNPGQRLSTPLRQVYYLYLVFVNIWLFLCPSELRHDWRFGPVPLFHSLSDSRSIWTALTLASFTILSLRLLTRRNKDASKVSAFSLSLSAATFLPSSNLFFLVGFVVAERVLFLPTMGGCLLVAMGIQRILTWKKLSGVCKYFVKIAVFFLILVHSMKVVKRNQVWESGLNLYVDALKLYPSDGIMFSDLGYIFQSRNNGRLAEECYTMAVRLAPNYSQPFRNYGSFLQKLGRDDEAKKMFRRAIEILGHTQRSKRSRRTETYLALANILSKNESHLEEAISTMQTIIRLEPEEPKPYVVLGKLMMRKNRSEEGRRIFESTFRLFPQDLQLRYGAAEACMEARDLPCAQHQFEAILALDRTQGLAMLKYGSLIAEKHNATMEELIQAHRYLQAVVDSDSSLAEAFYALALVDFQLNRQSQAEESLDKTLALQPGHSGAIKHLAELSYTRHDYTRTAELLGQFPASELGLRENSLYLRLTGSSYFELGLHSRAVALYQEVLKKHSQNAEAYLTLGKLYALSENFDEAEKFLKIAQKLNSTKTEAQEILRRIKISQKH